MKSNTNLSTRRDFLKIAGMTSAAIVAFPVFGMCKPEDIGGSAITVTEETINRWRSSMTDPVWGMISGKPDLQQIMGLFPRPSGKPAIDPKLVDEKMKSIRTTPEINTGYDFLDLSIRRGLAHIDLTFQSNHPKYGVVEYGKVEHDGFPPTIIAAVDALSAWGMNQRAAELFSYWLTRFVKEDGAIDYYGPSLSEYGQLLHTAKILYKRAGGDGWLEDGFLKLDKMAESLLKMHSEAIKTDGLLSGVPEADTRDEAGKYFHNNAWIARGLSQWANLCQKAKRKPATPVESILSSSERLKSDTLQSIRQVWPSDTNDWWLPARLGNIPKPKSMTDGNEASYTNYRYWLELLSSGILPDDMANRLVSARLNGGGQFCGMTRFRDWLDDWPLADYLYGLWNLGRKDDFLLSLFGHISYHQCEGHLTAYEQFRFPGDPKGSWRADYCLPSQLVAARAGRLINLK